LPGSRGGPPPVSSKDDVTMAQKKTGERPAGQGGNTPRGSRDAASSREAAKEKSRQQSRAVSAKQAKGKGGNVPRSDTLRNGARRPGQGGGGRPGGRLSGAMMAWGAVGLVIIVVIVFVVVDLTGSTNKSYVPDTPAPAAVLSDVTSVPTSVFNRVGIPTTANLAAPSVVSGQPPMTIDGKTPAMLYYGAEFCPFCAAERWGIVVALSRFGTFSGLKVTASSLTDTDAGTRTFSFYHSTYTSKYLSFFPIESETNIPAPGGGYTALQNPTPAEEKVIAKYSQPPFVQASPDATPGSVSFPFVDIDNKVIISGATYSPGILAGLSWSQIGATLDQPSNPIAQAIIGTSNYISAGICAATGGHPGSVCSSSGVQVAAKALKLK